RDPDNGFQEKGLVKALHKHLDELEEFAKKAAQAKAIVMKGSEDEDNDPKARLINILVRDSGDLTEAITTDLRRRSGDAKETFRRSLWIMFSMGLAGIVLLFVFLRFFYRWVFAPIRDLQQGAGRVAQGDFEHRIDVHSGDEMEDLAAAFNDMTGRLREMYRD